MRETISRLLKYAGKYNLFMLLAFLSSIISVSLVLYAPVLIGDAVNCIIAGEYSSMIPIIAKLLATTLGAIIFQWVMSFCTNKVAYKTVEDLRCDAYCKINTLPLKYIDSHSHGDIISRIVNDVDQVSDGLLQGLTQLFTGIVTIIGTLIFMFSINWAITLVVVVITPLSLFVASFIAKRSHKMFKEQQATQGELTGYIEELVGNQKVVKTFCYEERAQKSFEEVNQRLYVCGQKAQFYSSLSNPSTRFVNGVVYTAVAVIGSIFAIVGNPGISIGAITAFMTYANQYTKPFNEITAVITQVQAAFAAAGRLFEIMDEESTERESDREYFVEEIETDNSVKFDNVYFSYNPEKSLIEKLNVFVKQGERIAIVGPTGCGKTTLINLIMRFYEVTGGSIEVGGVNVKDMPFNSLRGRFGMVLQEIWLFNGTVAENIAYGKPDATKEEIISAAKSAHAHEFITRLPAGYNTIISEEGSNISQGQRQLLSIARVMLADPPMLILDEATSNIDTRTEIYIQKAFEKMMAGRTSFIVAHRLSTIKGADLILVMRDGKIEEQGKHEELLSKKGFYYELYSSQFSV